MRTNFKAVVALVCGAAGLLTAYLDMFMIPALIAGIIGIVSGRMAVNGDTAQFFKGMAVAGVIACIFTLCISVGGILGYAAAYLMA